MILRLIQLYFDLTQVYRRKERVQSRRIDLENRPLTKYFMNMHFDKKEQCAKENIVLLEKIVNAKALLLLVSIVYNFQLVRCERQFFV